jgi:alpha-glucosidase
MRWWQDAVFYQIYPRSFADGDGDGVGDLRGIISRLDYLRNVNGDALGVDAIWLSPVYLSPMHDFGYDVSDYEDIDPVFGTLTDLDNLIEAAHQRGLRVILDWIPNHTSVEHPWFVSARSSVSSPTRDWYVWRAPKVDGSPPNNWRSFFPRVGSAWTLDVGTGQYYLHSFSPLQPDLNWDNPAVESAMYRVIEFWLDRGVDGFRVDALPLIGKDPELRDNSFDNASAWGQYNIDWPSVHTRLRTLRKVVDKYGDIVLIGEVNVLDYERLSTYFRTGDECDLAHNFLLTTLPWNAAVFGEFIDRANRLAGPDALPAWYLGNHDSSRVATRYGSGQVGRARARLMAMALLTLRGVPFIYQGDELGLPDALISEEQCTDIDGRDPQRAPIPWLPPSAAGPGAGFTSGKSWLPVCQEAGDLNVRDEMKSGSSMLALYRSLIALRRTWAPLRRGTFERIMTSDDILSYRRTYDRDSIYVALNMSDQPANVCLADSGERPEGLILCSTGLDRQQARIPLGKVQLRPLEGLLIAGQAD